MSENLGQSLVDTGHSPTEKKVPLNPEVLEQTFQERRPVIQRIIDTYHFNFTPEEYWQQYLETIQFMDFESFIQLVDKVIDEHQDQPEITLFYPDKSEKYAASGPVENSETFMIRLLLARMKERGVNTPVKIITTLGELRQLAATTVVVIDDGVYTASQKVSQLTKIPHQLPIDLYTVGATDQAIEVIKEFFTKRARLPGVTGKDRFSYQMKLENLGELLSPEAKQVFIELFAQTVWKKLNGHPAGHPTWDDWLDHVRRNTQPLLWSKPLVFSPFKLPDEWSQNRSLVAELAPLDTSAYIQPEYFFENQASARGPVPLPEQISKLIKTLFRR